MALDPGFAVFTGEDLIHVKHVLLMEAERIRAMTGEELAVERVACLKAVAILEQFNGVPVPDTEKSRALLG